jgi:hypothetical protein
VLIGKDGGIKRRSDDPAILADWPTIIDAMPMRQAGGRALSELLNTDKRQSAT